MGTKGRSTPRVVCCAIPIARSAGKVLVVTSRKRPDSWVCEYGVTLATHKFLIIRGPMGPLVRLTTASLDSTLIYIIFSPSIVPKGGWETTDVQLEAAASREAFEEGPPISSNPSLNS